MRTCSLAKMGTVATQQGLLNDSVHDHYLMYSPEIIIQISSSYHTVVDIYILFFVVACFIEVGNSPDLHFSPETTLKTSRELLMVQPTQLT